MIEINFVEKKKINMSPYILFAAVVLSLLIISVSFFFYHTNIENKYASLQQERIEKTEIIAEITKLNTVERQQQTLQMQIEQLETSVYPSLFLLDDINANLPNGTYIKSYIFTVADGVTMSIHVSELSQAAEFTNNINENSYAENLNLINLEKIDDYYLATFNFGVNKEYLVEGADLNDI
ncbi:hypothetical protein GCM10011351_11410 [Paraliobacillus quinghaiensis]|uniref:Fimbrial assembly protein n=1 Tax=Paraliobacillus quinghaiensis TaxID=470815 RepID=A0A917WTR9_9BACI|nr:hypothetical protein [Paraliobacillus quinghaiensis]GGM27311.1 hypothetical protein GCM10011351_11410 [Paraliobacillus quinghaiensis]